MQQREIVRVHAEWVLELRGDLIEAEEGGRYEEHDRRAEPARLINDDEGQREVPHEEEELEELIVRHRQHNLVDAHHGVELRVERV